MHQVLRLNAGLLVLCVVVVSSSDGIPSGGFAEVCSPCAKEEGPMAMTSRESQQVKDISGGV